MAHINAESYYELMFSLMQYHKYSLTEIESMMPWEREILCQSIEKLSRG